MRRFVPTLALLLATVCWGLSFPLLKGAQSALNRSVGLGEEGIYGPLMMIGVRFVVAGVLWMAIMPAARRGWTPRGLGRVGLVAVLLTGGTICQSLGLALTTPAVSAFLTSLCVLWVPIMSTIALRRSPGWVTWLGVACATAGIWMLVGFKPTSPGWGELLGLACSIIYAGHLFALNAAVRRENSWRVLGGQFLMAGIPCMAAAWLMQPSTPSALWGQLTAPDVGWRLAAIIALPTMVAFAVQTSFQPRIAAHRAAIIYLFEPVVAAFAAWAMGGAALTVVEIAGAALIIAANALVELLSPRPTESAPAPVAISAPI